MPTPLSAEQAPLSWVAMATTAKRPGTTQTMPIADRMKLAEGRPLRRRFMAAMAQQDCGQCGYADCYNYSEAIASKSEARLNLCVPGGKETARMLKALYEEIDKSPGAAPAAMSSTERCLPRSRRPVARATIDAGPVSFAPPAERQGPGKGNPAYRV